MKKLNVFFNGMSLQVPQGQSESTISNGTANGIAVSTSSGGQGWKQEALHVPASTEVNPTLYEELKLGQDGAGFKRLKPQYEVKTIKGDESRFQDEIISRVM